jgi:hypothetical protein
MLSCTPPINLRLHVRLRDRGTNLPMFVSLQRTPL